MNGFGEDEYETLVRNFSFDFLVLDVLNKNMAQFLGEQKYKNRKT